jgi:UDP-3-O-[3-hydroxymyristoyl] N-acetylglucosamine deacetylase
MTGIGLHSGKEVQLTLKPGRPNHGIKFVRTDLPDTLPINAHFNNVVSTQMATTLGRGKITISTVEHLMAAFQGAGIDNAIVEVDAPEIPILDGSAARFYEAILSAGIEFQTPKQPILVLRRKVEVKVNEKWAVAEPSARLEIHGSIDWDHPAIGYQEYHYVAGKTSFGELASARTFGFLRDVEALKRMGLARGGSLDNAVVLDDALVLNPGGLRYPDEFVKHKVLDALGDFKLAGIELQAYFRLHRAGHDLHSQLLNAIFSNPDNFEIIEELNSQQPTAARVRTVLAAPLIASAT